ncbi:CIC11C00000003018 [Sungouiella intermedia]|uniref:CIC11C00000003018 n=1 Tax=Sungouiella intermedia TaxID=45354 RepID=A0A1L0G777_9ASCO|nr:CIC11C00000003018 [[Candida] intermedia]
MDAHVLDHHKENIQPLCSGRPALKLGAAFSEKKGRLTIAKQREEFENNLVSDEHDDPLQVYIDYIEWTHNHYPQGSNIDSGLLKLLERCTSNFRDTVYYKNDPRYLKVWLEYAGYSDLPRDIFVYLAKKDIGVQLALFYEEFARFLETKGLVADAREVYEIGLERNARPQPRLIRNFDQFKARTNAPEADGRSNMRALLSAVRMSSSPVTDKPITKKQKILVFKDEKSPTLKDTVFVSDPAARLGTIASRKKENSIAARPWAGEIYKQKIDTEKQPAKFQVFRDDDEQREPKIDFEVVNDLDGYCSIVRQPGKPAERVMVNLDLVYPSKGEEYCFSEILALRRKFSSSKNMLDGQTKPDREQMAESERNVQSRDEKEFTQTLTIPLRDEDTTQQSNSPTMTMFSRMTTKEVLGMFNEAAHNFQLDDESTRGFEESTNYDGFVTETVQLSKPEDGAHAATPPTDHNDSDAASSPFLDCPTNHRQ